MNSKTQLAAVAALVLIAGAGIYALTRRGAAAAAGEATARAAVGAIDGVIAGTVKGAAAIVGIPDTNAERCARAKAAGNTWDMSLYCTAGDFLAQLFRPADPPATDPYTEAGAHEWTVWDQEDADLGAAMRGIAFAETSGGAVTGIIRRR